MRRFLGKLPAYSTTKEVHYNDKRLTILYFVSCLVVLVYVVLDFFLHHRYAVYQTPSATLNSFVGYQSGRERHTNATWNTSGTLPAYCANTGKYAFVPRGTDAERYGGWEFANISCAFYPDAAIIKTPSWAFQVMTLESIEPPDCTVVQCRRNYFPVDPDNITFVLAHAFSTSWMEKASSLPLTHIYDAQDNLKYVFQPKFPVVLSVRQWLELANLDPETENPPTFPAETKPFFRTSGAALTVSLEYSNNRDWSLNNTELCEIKVSISPGLWGYTGPDWEYSAEYGQNVRYDRIYFSLYFAAKGAVGRFDFYQFTLQVVSAVVLLSVARGIVDFLASNLLPGSRAFSAAKADQADETLFNFGELGSGPSYSLMLASGDNNSSGGSAGL